MDIKGKTIVITGAARGLGQKMPEVVAGQGANVALVDLNHSKLQEFVRLCSATGGRARDYAVDVADESAVETLFNDVYKRLWQCRWRDQQCRRHE